MWAVRIIHESTLHESHHGNSFITLTYDDENVPEDFGLVPKDFRNFIRRLRSQYPQKIRYFQVGEYGNKCAHNSTYGQDTVKDCVYCNVGRPHFHACLFNISFRDLVSLGFKNDKEYFTSPSLAETWKRGHVQVGELTFESAAYAARYVLKKVNGAQASDHYMKIVPETSECYWVRPEYVTMSRRPGIGAGWFEKFSSDVFPSDEVPVPGVGVIKKAPRYYDEFLRSQDEGLFEEVKKLREVFRKEHADEYTPQRLMAKYKVKKAQTAQLRRTIE